MPAQPVSTLGVRRRIPHHRKILKFSPKENHDGSVPILGMGREVTIPRRIIVLISATPNRHELLRAVLLAPLLDKVNGL
jgi:hypothetical protein